MDSNRFVDAVRPEPCCILRLPMLPYSIGHEIILTQERNPLVTLSPAEFEKLPAAERIAATLRAVLVCCRSYSENSKPHRWLKLWHWVVQNFDDVLAAADKFFAYRYSGSTFPALADKEADEMANGKEDGRLLGGELLPRLIDYIIPRAEKLGYESAFDVPLGMALHLYFTALELSGHIRLENARERQIKEEMIEHREAIEKERAERRRKEAEKCQP